MTHSHPAAVTITVPADVDYFRSVRLAVGGLATLVGFDVEAIEDLRIGIDELCAALVAGGDGSDIHLQITAVNGVRIRIEGTTGKGSEGLDDERFEFSRQILSVIADDFGYTTDSGVVCCWLERHLDADGAADHESP